MLHPEPVHLARELLAELVEEILAQQLVLKCVQDSPLDLITSNGQAIRTCSLASRSKAHKAIGGADDETIPAHAHFVRPENRVTLTLMPN